jgi:hypothetical protein
MNDFSFVRLGHFSSESRFDEFWVFISEYDRFLVGIVLNPLRAVLNRNSGAEGTRQPVLLPTSLQIRHRDKLSRRCSADCSDKEDST